MNWYLDVLKKYAVFDGRARRQEFWMFALINFVISLILNLVLGMVGLIYALAVFLPTIGVGIRRLHDTGRSGWWLLIGLIPVVGFIVLLVFFVQDSQPGNNQYGSNPKNPAA
jgi:uncharacterized membrane protein YhaH (DUF805 family)